MAWEIYPVTVLATILLILILREIYDFFD